MTPDEIREALRKLSAKIQAQNDQDWTLLADTFSRDPTHLAGLAERLPRLAQLADDMLVAGVLLKLGISKMAADTTSRQIIEPESKE